MSVRKFRIGSWVLGMGTAALVLSGMSLTASAASGPSTFDARYTQNAQVEAKLVQQAQAEGGSSSTITALSSTVQTIGAQVAALYASEQALETAKAGIPSVTTGDRAKLQTQKRTLTRELRAAKATLKKDRKSKNSVAKRELELRIKTWTAQLRQVTFELAHPQAAYGSWKSHPYAGGLTALRQSILDLQQAAIHYTRLWVAAAKPSGTTSTGNPATITGLAYAAATITIPATGSPATTDSVAVMPIVKDAQGNVLTDSGTYSIVGATGATGVSIDATTGQVSVSPGATAGAYEVTYTQGGVVETAGITVSQ